MSILPSFIASRTRHVPSKSRLRYQCALHHLEMLEVRTLMSVTVGPPYQVATVTPNAAVYVTNGDLWVYDPNNVAMERIKNGAIDSAPGSVISLDSPTLQPRFAVAGSNGHIYLSDFSGGIDDVDTVAGTVSQDLFAGSNFAEYPVFLTVASNSSGGDEVWFVGAGDATVDTEAGGLTIEHHISTIGRYDPVTHAVSTLTTTAVLDDSVAAFITPKGTDSVWVAMEAKDDSDNLGGFTFGTNRILSASFNGAAVQVDSTFNVNSGDPVSDANNVIGGIVSDGSTGVWFTLANQEFTDHPVHGTDQLVHANANGSVQTSYLIHNTDPVDTVATPDNALDVGGLNTDVNGNVWFIEQSGAEQVGYFDGTSFTTYANSTGAQPVGLASNADGTKLVVNLIGDDFDAGYPILEIAVTPDATFSGSASDLSAREDTAITGTLLATFTAPAPTGTYSATIAWGDSTSTVVTPSYLGSNTYAVIISSKTFATQGIYNGTVSINDSVTGLAGTLHFTSNISDIPLNVTSVTALPLILRIVTVAGTFTDDSDLALSTWTATVNWGDSSSSTGVIVRDPTQSGRYIVLAIHQYHTRGTYTVKLTVTTTESLAAVTNSSLTTTVNAR
ncbi:MAG TPA: hypothetical protein VGN88_11190 [Phycisphaerae bacterium]|jgi:hypothetical protein